ncbi:MAG TPA: hypothetical protein VFE03_03070 [Caulobacteraceae bacterium]|jgi:hypothetical protein|nr:hypothetical protein [Caulobacteraceae bacterium]
MSWRRYVDRAGAGLERLLGPVWGLLDRGLEALGMRKPKTRRDTISLVLSAIFHIIALAYVAQTVVPRYALTPPTPVEEPVPVEIVPPPPPPEPIVPPPKVEPPKLEEQPLPPKPEPIPPKPEPTPPQPAPPAPTPTPPKPEPPKPEPPKPAPAKPSPLPAPVQQTTEQPKPAPAKVAPAPAPTPKPAPAPVIQPSTAPPTPTPGPPKPNPSTSQSPSPLNVHAPAQQAPLNVPTLPMAPAGGSPGKPGSANAGGAPSSGAPGPNQPGGAQGSRLNPYPYGVMPNGGPGLRGTLVGCANADAVRLTPSERARCNERFGANTAAAPVLDPIPPAKRNELDRAAARNAAERAYRGSVPNGNPGPNAPEKTGGLGEVPSVRPQ